MKASFPEAIKQTFDFEGWHSNSAFDPGGDTILGISRTFWPHEHSLIRQMDPQDARAYAEGFYLKEFWEPMGCDDLSYPLDCVAFDSSVNPGPSWCKQRLDTGVREWRNLLTLREGHYRARAAEEQAKGRPYPLKGLLNRCAVLRQRYEAFV